MDKWVPVTEKLPTKEGLYIVTMDGEIAGQKEPFASTNYFENGQWDDGDSVIAWMRLPEPYRPKDNKEKLEQELMNDEITPDEHVERYNALMELEPQSFGPPELHEHI